MKYIYQNKRGISLFFAFLMIFQIAGLPVARALTSGPSQPEVQSFEPATTTEMVNLFTGDFVYNIPLFELPGPKGGYPFNLSYHAGVSMDTESSWCGLGWNITPGAVSRQMRGIPDEFDGDSIYSKVSLAPSVTIGLGAGTNQEVLGKDLGYYSSSASTPLDFGFSVYQNNYRGVGFSLGSDVGYHNAVSSLMTNAVGMYAGLSIGEGVTMLPSLGLDQFMKHTQAIPFTVQSALQPGIAFEAFNGSKDKRYIENIHDAFKMTSPSLSFASSGNMPQLSLPVNNVSISSAFKAGGSAWGSFSNFYMKGFYNEQSLLNSNKRVPFSAFGYLNYQHRGSNANAVLDVNREKDGSVNRESPNLASPSLTFDTYSITGQGISAMYRPVRNDFGVVQEISSTSTSRGTGVGSENTASSSKHYATNNEINRSTSHAGPWTGDSTLIKLAFMDKEQDNIFEPWIYKKHGELAAQHQERFDALGGDEAVRLRLSGDGDSSRVESVLENAQWSNPVPKEKSPVRQTRANVVQHFTNQDLLRQDGQSLISLFNIEYKDNSGTLVSYSRQALPKHHIAAYTTLTPDGIRYNYALPAYNLHQEEVTFSVPHPDQKSSRIDIAPGIDGDPKHDYVNTHKYLNRTELPAYAHSHLLTSIVGPDYVDLTDNGVTEDDLGYWVKFTYAKTTTDAERYKWRHPFSKALYQEGSKSNKQDDRGTFVYGEKEIWYLSQAETKTHVAIFTTRDREDGFGANSRLQNTNERGKSLQALQEIKLYTRAAGISVPIRTVKFEYDYSLCPAIENSGTYGGKLTLKKVWFEHGRNTRGKLNPYVFTYSQANPAYDLLAYDRWGNYKPYPIGERSYNQDFSYVDQDQSKKEVLDEQMSAWNLKEIQLPSGGKVIVDYETDDYAYVQHKVAMQMTDIVDPYSPIDALLPTYKLRDDDLKIRFTLEGPLANDFTPAEQKEEVLKYLDTDTQQLYFKILVNLKSSGENKNEYVSGYADLDMSRTMGLEKDASGKYTYGFFYVASISGYHPFSLRAWQHLRINQPEFMATGINLKPTSNTTEKLNAIRSLASSAASVRNMFSGFNLYCKTKDWGREVDARRAWVRLNSCDKIKFGGGSRVRQITMKDQWAEDEEGTYGQVYDYTVAENGIQISSGVATYEPLNGGDENALHYVKKYPHSTHQSNGIAFFEYPLNESYYPGPQVGYRKVSVYSLPSARLAGLDVKNCILSDGNPLFPTGDNIHYGTSGKSVYEFYTAKEFPVITHETEKVNKSFELQTTIPFVGNVSISKLTASQGYSIITNDMHGRLKRISQYKQKEAGDFVASPVSWMQYNYNADTIIYEKQNVLTLSNSFTENADGTLSRMTGSRTPHSQMYTMGQQVEVFGDTRQFTDHSWTTGTNSDQDILDIPLLSGTMPISISSQWPRVTKTTTQLRTVVTNKIISRSGVLQSVEVYYGGAFTKAQYLKWDKLTGTPVLTLVKNNSVTPVYRYVIPAFAKYPAMGGAYQNTGLIFSVKDILKTSYDEKLYSANTVVGGDFLFPGDEIVLYNSVEGKNVPIALITYMGKRNRIDVIYSDVNLTANEYTGMVVRSGFRNQLTNTAAMMEALDDPTVDGDKRTYEKTISVLKRN